MGAIYIFLIFLGNFDAGPPIITRCLHPPLAPRALLFGASLGQFLFGVVWGNFNKKKARAAGAPGL